MAQWVEDLPDIATILTRFDIAVGCCAGCGCGMPLAKICALYHQLHLRVTPGGLSQAMDRLATKSFATYEALKTELAAQAVITPDETGWRLGGRSA